MPQITVKELIALLAEQPPESLVETEGCDCEGPCNGIRLNQKDSWRPVPTVTILRGND